MTDLTVIILTGNEELHIGRCLESGSASRDNCRINGYICLMKLLLWKMKTPRKGINQTAAFSFVYP